MGAAAAQTKTILQNYLVGNPTLPSDLKSMENGFVKMITYNNSPQTKSVAKVWLHLQKTGPQM